jgi:hypothetical protein
VNVRQRPGERETGAGVWDLTGLHVAEVTCVLDATGAEWAIRPRVLSARSRSPKRSRAADEAATGGSGDGRAWILPFEQLGQSSGVSTATDLHAPTVAHVAR